MYADFVYIQIPTDPPNQEDLFQSFLLEDLYTYFISEINIDEDIDKIFGKENRT